jgi:tRNA(Ile)-lysidine synthase
MSDLPQALQRRLAQAPPGPLCVGYSGGLDSSVLLHALGANAAARARGLRALHIDHGLHPDSTRWAGHCRATCNDLQISLAVVRVDVDHSDTLGREGAARHARHAAFAAHLADGALLALAHHRDDQAETLLLRLLHGAGHEGLAGMRELRRCGAGWLWRPWLDLPRAALHDYARANDVRWIEDPSNSDRTLARNHLRHAVLPALQSRWPDATRRIAAAAARARDEADLLLTLGQRAMAQAQGVDPATLSLHELRAQPAALRRQMLGLWLDQLGLPRPPPGVWARIAPDLLAAREDSEPKLMWRGAELRRYRDLLYAMPPLPEPDANWTRDWDGSEPLCLPPGFGTLRLDPARPIESLLVRPRRGGERLHQAGAHRELRTLLQDLGVPPWVRARLPLLCDRAGELLAAGDLALAPRFAQQLREAGTRLRWQPDRASID